MLNVDLKLSLIVQIVGVGHDAIGLKGAGVQRLRFVGRFELLVPGGEITLVQPEPRSRLAKSGMMSRCC